MTNESYPELDAIDMNIRTSTRVAQANRDMAEHFTALAEQAEAQADYWIDVRNRTLGALSLNNVIPLQGSEEGEIA